MCAIRQDNWELTLGRGLLPDGRVYLRLERNVRELFQVVEQAAGRAEDGLIARHHLPVATRTAPAPEQTDEKVQVQAALDEARGNRSEAARLLGVSRRTLYRRLEKLGLA